MNLVTRKSKILELRKKGLTYREIALKFSISTERVRQIIHGIKPSSVDKMTMIKRSFKIKRK